MKNNILKITDVILSMLICVLLVLQTVNYIWMLLDIPICFSQEEFTDLLALFAFSFMGICAKIYIAIGLKKRGSIFLLILGMACIIFWARYDPITVSSLLRGGSGVHSKEQIMIVLCGVGLNVFLCVSQILLLLKNIQKRHRAQQMKS